MSLKHAILAMLQIEEGTGYDLTRRFNRSIGYFWPASHQQIYKELKQMAASGLLEFEEAIQAGKPLRKVYRVTSEGLDSLSRWLSRPAAEAKLRDPLLVKLFAGNLLQTDEILDELADHIEKHQRLLREHERLAERLRSLPEALRARYTMPWLTLRLGIHFQQAWLAWAEEARTFVQEGRTL